VTLVSGAGIYKLQSIERFTKTKIRREHVPTPEAVEHRRSDALFEKLRTALEAGDFPRETPLVERLLELGYTPTEVAAAILHHFAPPAAVRPAAADTSPAPPEREHEHDRTRSRRPVRFDPRRGGGQHAARRKFGPRGRADDRKKR
jgi:ATP-dependent RNA helicase DeaD